MSKVTDWKKYDPYFSEDEFECKDVCGFCNVDDAFLDRLVIARIDADIPFWLSSGCRCVKHNKKVKGSKNSDHLATETQNCCGTDIKVKNESERFIILRSLIKAGFNRIGIAKNFIHAGHNPKNPQNVVWLY